MTLEVELLKFLSNHSDQEVWDRIVQDVASICKMPINSDIEKIREIIERDRRVGEYDNFLSSCAWELWGVFDQFVKQNSTAIKDWWQSEYDSHAVLILDGLSLRELPWIIEGAKEHGYSSNVSIHGAEIPGDTNAFARALGLTSRSQLQSNGARNNQMFINCTTESTDDQWLNCIDYVGSTSNCFFWHHWPDCNLHNDSVTGQGIRTFMIDINDKLTNPDFWKFVEKLATGRKLVITSDHGYAATGDFPDEKGESAEFLKKHLKAGRYASVKLEANPFSPPIVVSKSTNHGDHIMAIGRKKWKVSGGYPTLAHGGLTLLEMLVPFVELTKN